MTSREGANEGEANVIAMGQEEWNFHVVELSGRLTVLGRRRLKTLYRRGKNSIEREKKKENVSIGIYPIHT